MLSIIVQEHREGHEFVLKMLHQTSLLKQNKEMIFVTSSPEHEFRQIYGLDNNNNYNFPIRVFGDVHNPAQGRNTGGYEAIGDDLVFLDCHSCFDQTNMDRLLDTLNRHPKALIGPVIDPIEFPSCERMIGSVSGHGAQFKFINSPWEWGWLDLAKENGKEITDREYPVPFICSCAFAMKKTTWNVFCDYCGFLGDHIGVGWEEEKTMRLWRLGHPTYHEPRASFGHYFKGITDHKKWDEHSAKGYFTPRIIGLYVNVFDKEIWNHIDSMLRKSWGSEYINGLKYAEENYSHLRARLEPLKDNIDEHWFLKIK